MYFLQTSLVFLSINLFSVKSLFLLIDQQNCPDGWQSLTKDKCFQVSSKKFDFHNSVAFCKKNLNSKLIMFRTIEENKDLSRLLFEQLNYDEFFWIGGKVLNRKGDFIWLDECLKPSFNNFHINNHEFNLYNESEEYLVLTNTLNEISTKEKRKVRGTWCSFPPKIMLLAICEIYLNDNNKPDCKSNQNINMKVIPQIDLNDLLSNESDPNLLYEDSLIRVTKIQVKYLIVGLTLMFILIIGMIAIFKASLCSKQNDKNDNEIEINQHPEV